jgi:hypothetical protein
MPYKKGDKVATNVGRAKGMVCVVVAVIKNQVPTPSGGVTDRVSYNVRTSNGNILRRSADKIAAVRKGRA